MAVVVFFHAHPDDEAIFTGGTIARLTVAGHRVVVVVTGSELGLAHLGTEQLAVVRQDETRRAAVILGVSRVAFLGYRDSGLAGDPANQAPGACSPPTSTRSPAGWRHCWTKRKRPRWCVRRVRDLRAP